MAHQPQRMCIGCRIKCDKSRLFRVVRADGGILSGVAANSAPGRGAYFCGSLRCVERAEKKGLLSRALRGPIPATVWESLKADIAAWSARRGQSEAVAELPGTQEEPPTRGDSMKL